MEYDQIKLKRKQLIKDSYKVSHYKKGQLNVHNSKICAICARPLTQFDNFENRYEVVFDYQQLDYRAFKANICERATSCDYYINHRTK